MMKISRRMFLGGMTAVVSLPKSGWAALGTPRLKFGVVSDIHLTRRSKKPEAYAYGSSSTFKAALEYFRDQGADAVVCAGDMADRGTLPMLKVCGEVWREVFPGNKAPDGRTVEPVFVYGNHDSDKNWFEKASGLLRGKSEEEAQAIRATAVSHNEATAWKEAFGEDWAPVYLKRVKGYAFVGAHWGHEKELGAFLEAHRGELAGSKPFFEVQHPHPKGTLYGKYSWGDDSGASTQAMAAFPNAVSFSGHSHTSVAFEASVSQQAFTSIGCSSLSYQTLFGRKRMKNVSGYRRPQDPRYKAASSKSREGLLVTVYDSCLVIERREFVKNAKLGLDWVIPTPYEPTKAPYSYAAEQKRLRAPEFPKGAVVKVSKAGEFFDLTLPSAVYSPEHARTVWYELSAFAADGKAPIHQTGLVADAFFAPFGQTPETVVFRIRPEELGDVKACRVEITARDLYDRVSSPLVGTIVTQTV